MTVLMQSSFLFYNSFHIARISNYFYLEYHHFCKQNIRLLELSLLNISSVNLNEWAAEMGAAISDQERALAGL